MLVSSSYTLNIGGLSYIDEFLLIMYSADISRHNIKLFSGKAFVMFYTGHNVAFTTVVIAVLAIYLFLNSQ